MQKCTSKARLNCLYLTKETKYEVLKILEPNLGENDYVSIIEDNEREVVVYHFGWHKAHYYYNNWYVEDCNDCSWDRYTDEEFKKQFQLIE